MKLKSVLWMLFCLVGYVYFWNNAVSVASGTIAEKTNRALAYILPILFVMMFILITINQGVIYFTSIEKQKGRVNLLCLIFCVIGVSLGIVTFAGQCWFNLLKGGKLSPFP